MTMFKVPEVLVQVTPKVRVFVNGGDVTDDWEAIASALLMRLGKRISWVQKNVSFGRGRVSRYEPDAEMDDT